jgi:hypothetical protein
MILPPPISGTKIDVTVRSKARDEYSGKAEASEPT